MSHVHIPNSIVRRIYFRDYKKIIIIKNGEKVFKENDKQR